MGIYFCLFLSSAWFATTPDPTIAEAKWLAEKGSTQVKFQHMGLPLCHGIIATPARLPSDLVRQSGSRRLGMWDFLSANAMILLTILCRAKLPADR
ncbi:hypothetical protein GJ496_008711 [Pomphorhynchus laevis]|nr:hypothetical protein GJ496_008711 [Pomphorhynchus laevis]